MDWQTPIAALAGIVGVVTIAWCYSLVLSAPTIHRDRPQSPVLSASGLSKTPEGEANAGAEPRLDLSYDQAPDPAESPTSEPEAGLDLTPDDGDQHEPARHPTAPKAARLADHRFDGAVTSKQLSQLKSELRISVDQEPKWASFVAALVKIEKLQTARNDDQRSTDDLNEELFTRLRPSALPLLQSLSDDQMRGASRLSVILGFKSLAAMVAAAKASRVVAMVNKPAEPRVEVTPALPPIVKVPALADHRYDGLLTKAEIGRIKLSLKLTSQQEAFWPPVAAFLREVGQQQMAQIDSGQRLNYAMSGDMAQRFYSVALPLLQTLTDDQKAEVRRRARVMGLEAYASYL